MLTMSSERFVKIQRESPPEYQQYLMQVTKYQAAQNCKVQYSVSSEIIHDEPLRCIVTALVVLATGC